MRPGQPQAATEPETINLDPERRAKLVSFVETNTAMPDNAKQRFLAELKQDEVPVATVEKLESRIGG
jgi:hypothetical protein